MLRSRFAAALAWPLLASASSSVAAQPRVAAPVQTITVQSFAYSPSPIHLAAGKAVTLNFVNRAGKGHDFTAHEFFAASRILSGPVSDGEVDLGGGQAASVTLIPAAGTYQAHCGRPFHKMMGMRTTIVVQ